MLGQLQLEILSDAATLGRSEGLAIGGGAALAILGIIESDTASVDYFTTSATSVERSIAEIAKALAKRTYTHSAISTKVGTAAFTVTSPFDSCEITVTHEYREWPISNSKYGPMLSVEEVAASTALAVQRRGAARDFLDLHDLARLYSPTQICVLARKKDRSFSSEALARKLDGFADSKSLHADVPFERLDPLLEWSKRWARLIDPSLPVEKRPPSKDRRQPRTSPGRSSFLPPWLENFRKY